MVLTANLKCKMKKLILLVFSIVILSWTNSCGQTISFDKFLKADSTANDYCKKGLIYFLVTGETYSNMPMLCDGWRCDTINGGDDSKMVYHNPYDIWDNIAKYRRSEISKTYIYYFYKEGKRFTGKISDSVLYGRKNQIQFKANCINGMLQGKGIFYFTRFDNNFPLDGKIKLEGTFENGEIIGEWTHYEHDHKYNCFIDSKLFYVKGKAYPQKITEFYNNGLVKSETEYADDYLVSFKKEYGLAFNNSKATYLVNH